MIKSAAYTMAIGIVAAGLVACAAMQTASVPKDGEVALPVDYKS